MTNNKVISCCHEELEKHNGNLRKRQKQQAAFAKEEECLALLDQIILHMRNERN